MNFGGDLTPCYLPKFKLVMKIHQPALIDVENANIDVENAEDVENANMSTKR
jgi:hypothetical protein